MFVLSPAELRLLAGGRDSLAHTGGGRVQKSVNGSGDSLAAGVIPTAQIKMPGKMNSASQVIIQIQHGH